MKTTISLVALSVLTTLAFTSPVLAQVKGGEKLAGARTPVSAVTTSVAPMNCATEVRAVKDQSARGAFKQIAVYTAHLCPSCQNREVATGAGKAATRKVEHSCKTASVCCNVKS